jgi:hypothetical protein
MASPLILRHLGAEFRQNIFAFRHLPRDKAVLTTTRVNVATTARPRD